MPINQSRELYSKFINPKLPDAYKDRFFGIILLDSDLGIALRPYEHETHYQFENRPQRGFQLYDAFKNTIIDHGIIALKNKHGIGAGRGDDNQRARLISRQTKNDVNELFKQNGISGGILKSKKTMFNVNVHNTSNLKEMNLLDDELSVTFYVNNKTSSNVISKINISVYDENKRNIEDLIIDNEKEIEGESKLILQACDLKLDRNKYENGCIYKIQCSAEIMEKTYNGSIDVYVNRLREQNFRDFHVLPSVNTWPNNNKRVDTNEKLEDINCLVSSSILDPVNVYLDIQLHSKENGRSLNGRSFVSDIFELNPNGTEEIYNIPDIILDDESTEGIGTGQIYCKFSLRAAENFQDSKKGEQLASGQLLIYFNCDPPGTGIFEEVSCEQMEDSVQALYRFNVETSGFICIINSNHKSYNIFSEQRDDFLFEVYQKDLVIRQGLLVCMHRGLAQAFGYGTEEELETLDKMEKDELLNEKHGELLNQLLREN